MRYLLDQVQSGRDLPLMMSRAHAQMGLADGAITPPLFGYEVIPGDAQGMRLRYDSPRMLCTLLAGSIEGAAERYGERAQVVEQACMKKGAPACVFAIHFSPAVARLTGAPAISGTSYAGSGLPDASQAGPEDPARREAQRQLADAVYAILPDEDGATLPEAQAALRERFPTIPEAARPFMALEAINHLVHAGWVSTSANDPGNTLGSRRYWRVPRSHPSRR